MINNKGTGLFWYFLVAMNLIFSLWVFDEVRIVFSWILWRIGWAISLKYRVNRALSYDLTFKMKCRSHFFFFPSCLTLHVQRRSIWNIKMFQLPTTIIPIRHSSWMFVIYLQWVDSVFNWNVFQVIYRSEVWAFNANIFFSIVLTKVFE